MPAQKLLVENGILAQIAGLSKPAGTPLPYVDTPPRDRYNRLKWASGKDNVMASEETLSKPAAPGHSIHPGATKVGSTSFFNGSLEGHEDTVIDGRFQGKINLASSVLTVSRGAKVEADVQVRTLILSGELTGTVVAAERVMISETARMNGDIRTARISIANGAQFKGGIKIEKA
jgi:cytoskeletal protein CcmA (bactofilin family)